MDENPYKSPAEAFGSDLAEEPKVAVTPRISPFIAIACIPIVAFCGFMAALGLSEEGLTPSVGWFLANGILWSITTVLILANRSQHAVVVAILLDVLGFCSGLAVHRA